MTRTRIVAAVAALTLPLVACASTGSSEAPAATGPNGCPSTVVFQTSWFSDITYGGAYQLIADSVTVDKGKKRISGEIVDRGKKTGVRLEIRAGGPALGNQPVASSLAQDRSITLAQMATEEQVSAAAIGQETVSVFAPLDRDPVVLMWDPKTYPQFKSVRDIGKSDATVLAFRSTSTDYLTGAGVLKPGQMDYSFTGSPDLFIAGGGKKVASGFATGDPWMYQAIPQWGRPVGKAYVADAGYPNYRNLVVVRKADLGTLSTCLRWLVPVMQRGQADFIAKPETGIGVLEKVNGPLGNPSPWPLPQAQAGAKVMRDDKIVTGGEDGVLGDVDPARVSRILEVLTKGDKPIVKDAADLTAEDLSTNEFLDKTVTLS